MEHEFIEEALARPVNEIKVRCTLFDEELAKDNPDLDVLESYLRCIRAAAAQLKPFITVIPGE